MQNITKHIPNALTCCNLLCGFFGIYALWLHAIGSACLLIIIAAFFDFADGLAARAFNAHSPIGKDLDSLADLVTFGVLPGMIYVYLINAYFPEAGFGPYLCGVVPVCSALRLAKFNHDTRQTNGFIGMPTPAHAIWAASFPFALEAIGFRDYGSVWHIVIAAWVMSALLVSELPFFSFKLKSIKERENIYAGILIMISVVSVVGMGAVAGTLIIAFYVLLSFIKHRLN